MVESKLCELCSCLLYIFPRIDLRDDKDERSLVGTFPFSYEPKRNLIKITLKIAMPIMLEKIDLKLCNVSLSNENVEVTIVLASFPRKADRNIVTNYDCNKNLLKTKKREQLMI